MVELLVLLYLLIVLIDLINLVDLRKLVYSFLLSKRNLKAAKEIHLMQTNKDRLTLSYIKEHAIFPKEFRFFQRCWLVNISLLIPQYVAIIVLNFFSLLATSILIIVFLVPKILFAAIIRSQFSSARISRFDKRFLDKRN